MWIRHFTVTLALTLFLQHPGFAAKKPDVSKVKPASSGKNDTLDKFKGTCQSRKLVPNASSCRGEGGIMGTYHQVGDSCVCTKFH